MCAGGEEGTKMNMAKLRSGTAQLRVETGRWIGLKREVESVVNVGEWRMLSTLC